MARSVGCPSGLDAQAVTGDRASGNDGYGLSALQGGWWMASGRGRGCLAWVRGFQPVGRLARCDQRQEQAAVVKPLFTERHDPERRERLSGLHEGIPDFLSPSLVDWTLVCFLAGVSGMRIIDQQMILRLERRARRALSPRAKNDLNTLVREFQNDDGLLLDAIDFALSQESNYGGYASYTNGGTCEHPRRGRKCLLRGNG